MTATSVCIERAFTWIATYPSKASALNSEDSLIRTVDNANSNTDISLAAIS